MACAVGWTTTRVRLGRRSRIRRLARGGSACARNASSGTRLGSAEPGRYWWCTGSRAWHPLAPSWVPLPTPRQVKHTGFHGILGSCNAWFDSGYILRVSLRRLMDDFHAISTCLGGLWILRSILVSSLPANLAEEEVAALVVNFGSGMLSTGFASISAPHTVFPMIAGRSACTR